MPLNKMAKLVDNERNEQLLFGCLQLIYRHVSSYGNNWNCRKPSNRVGINLMKSLSRQLWIYLNRYWLSF